MEEKEKEIDLFGEGISYFARFRTDGGSCKLYTQEYVDSKDKEIERLNNIIEELEEFLTKVIETGAGIEQITCKNIKNYIQELKERK